MASDLTRREFLKCSGLVIFSLGPGYYVMAGTIEGIKVKGRKAFSVQYHPEASPGPHDARYLFDYFIELIEGGKE